MARIESELESDLGPAWIWQPFSVSATVASWVVADSNTVNRRRKPIL